MKAFLWMLMKTKTQHLSLWVFLSMFMKTNDLSKK